MRAVADRLSDFLNRVDLRAERLEQLAHLGAAARHDRIELGALSGVQVQLFRHPFECRSWGAMVVPAYKKTVGGQPDGDSRDERTDEKQQREAF